MARIDDRCRRSRPSISRKLDPKAVRPWTRTLIVDDDPRTLFIGYSFLTEISAALRDVPANAQVKNLRQGTAGGFGGIKH